MYGIAGGKLLPTAAPGHQLKRKENKKKQDHVDICILHIDKIHLLVHPTTLLNTSIWKPAAGDFLAELGDWQLYGLLYNGGEGG